ncbi:unnamed protein product [Auanema sp. JU1783]|nr:unnamed protein product [Auanema sp. JU1783]
MVLFDKVPIQEYFTNLFNYDVEYEETNPNYRCLRGAFHVVNVMKFFMVLEFITIFIYVLTAFPYFLLWIGFHLLYIFVTLYGLKKERHRFLWPAVILAGIIFLLWSIVAVIKFLIGMFNTDYFLKLYGQGHHEDFWTRMLIVLIIKAVVLLTGAIIFWRVSVFHTTRKYFEAKADGEIVVTNPDEATGLDKLMQPV